MTRYSETEALFATHAWADFARLNRLDDLWTFYLGDGAHRSPAHSLIVAKIVDEMREIFVRVDGHAELLRTLIMDQSADFEVAFANILAATSLSPDKRGSIEDTIRARDSIVQFVLEELEVVQRLSDDESKRLHSKLSLIREGVLVTGDFTFRFKCALSIALLAASIIIMTATGTILLPAIVEAVEMGTDAEAIVALFVSYHGVQGFLLEAIHAVDQVISLIENGCFNRTGRGI